MNYPSPRTPGHYPDHSYEYWDAGPSPTPTPPYHPMATPRRTSTAWGHHSRGTSYSSPRPAKDSPRFNSQGYYATATDPRPSVSDYRRPRTANSSHTRQFPVRDHHRTSTPCGESDEDDVFEVWGRTYVIPSGRKGRLRRHHHPSQLHGDWFENDGAWYTDYDYLQSTAPYYGEYSEPPPPYPGMRSPTAVPFNATPSRTPTAHSHRRQQSTPLQRPGTAMPSMRPSSRRPSVSAQQQPPPPSSKRSPTEKRKVTEKDMRRHGIAADYSVKNWDPEEVPILLLGSVFDANSLGKWIYDWTVYRHGPASPMADMAGELWLLLIKLYGKVKKAEETVGIVRKPDDEETMDYYIDIGNKLQDRFVSLLKHCEKPMLSANKKDKTKNLGTSSGVMFVDTLFGRDKRLGDTEKFMTKAREFDRKFSDNCDAIIRNPTR